MIDIQHSSMTSRQTILILLLLLVAQPGNLSTRSNSALAKNFNLEQKNKNFEATPLRKYARKATFKIMGLGCAACIKGVERKLRLSKGVLGATISLKPKGYTIIYYSAKGTSLSELLNVIKQEGYLVDNLECKSVTTIPKSPVEISPEKQDRPAQNNATKNRPGTLPPGLKSTPPELRLD